ncbi:MAG TPA: hypothetical protein VJC16_00350 [Candidatus Nanoarchaeia archaeon]|nr:hypothetical protein [Candidatus Nanoarchaeia archaeon]
MTTIDQLLESPLFAGVDHTPGLRNLLGHAAIRANREIRPHGDSLIVLMSGTLLREVSLGDHYSSQGPYTAPDVLLTFSSHPLAVLARNHAVDYRSPAGTGYTAAQIPLPVLHGLTSAFPQIQDNLDAILRESITFTQKAAVSFLLPRVEERMHAYLTAIAEKYGDQPSFSFPFSQSLIAHITGGSRESLSRCNTRKRRFTLQSGMLTLHTQYHFTTPKARALRESVARFAASVGAVSLPEQLRFLETYITCLTIPQVPHRLVTFFYAVAQHQNSNMFPLIPQHQIGELTRISRESISRFMHWLGNTGYGRHPLVERVEQLPSGYRLHAPYRSALHAAERYSQRGSQR